MSKRKGIQLAYPYDERRFQKWGNVALIQPKLNGERCRAIISGHNVTLLTSTEELFVSVPHINAHLRNKFGGLDLELDGELYVHGMTLQQIHSIVSRRTNLHEDYEKMQFHIFDVVSGADQVSRIVNLIANVKEDDIIKPVRTDMVTDAATVMKMYDQFLTDGYEGFILRQIGSKYKRARSTDMMKFKPWQTDIYTITGYEEEHDIYGVPKGRLGALWLNSDIADQQFKVGSGFTDYDRETLWKYREELPSKICQISYQTLTPKKIPFHSFFTHTIFNADSTPFKY